MSNKQKDITVIEGDGSNLDISPVYDHISNIQQPRRKKTQEIVIPKVKDKKIKPIKIKSKTKKEKSENKRDNKKE